MTLTPIINAFILSVVVAINPAHAQTNFSSDLRDGNHVLLMRHADAPGFGDPTGYRLDQCSTQRNLGQRGKTQAIAIGQWLSTQEINAANVISSPWCRCIDTAKLLHKGSVKISPALGSFFDDMSLENEQTLALEKLIRNQLNENPTTPLILVTHHVNIQAYTGKMVNVGDMILVKVDKNGKKVSQQIFPSPNF